MRLIRNSRLCIIVTISLLLLTFSFLLHLNDSQYDQFYPYHLSLESPKIDYLVGEKIQLIANIMSDYPATIRGYKQRTKSFALSIRAAIGTEHNFADNDFHSPFSRATAEDAIEVIQIDSEKPFQLKLQGQVMQTKEKEILFDFGKFGTSKKSSAGKFLVGSYWQSILPNSVDSLEDFTNLILLKIASTKT